MREGLRAVAAKTKFVTFGCQLPTDGPRTDGRTEGRATATNVHTDQKRMTEWQAELEAFLALTAA